MKPGSWPTRAGPISPSSTRRTRARVPYRWPFNGSVYVGGARPDEMDWHVLSEPGWFLEQGWALTPETAGIAERDGYAPHRKPSVGWVRRRAGEAMMMIGGRHLGGDSPVNLVVSLDERPLTTIVVRPGFFLDFVNVPAAALAGDGRYAKLTVSAQVPAEAAGDPTREGKAPRHRSPSSSSIFSRPIVCSTASTRAGTSPSTTRGRRNRGAG